MEEMDTRVWIDRGRDKGKDGSGRCDGEGMGGKVGGGYSDGERRGTSDRAGKRWMRED